MSIEQEKSVPSATDNSLKNLNAAAATEICHKEAFENTEKAVCACWTLYESEKQNVNLVSFSRIFQLQNFFGF